MPKIRFGSLPRPVWEHLLARVGERQVTLEDLSRLQDWARTGPEAPAGDWYKDFTSFVLCGTGEFPKTVLSKGMMPFGEALKYFQRFKRFSARFLAFARKRFDGIRASRLATTI